MNENSEMFNFLDPKMLPKVSSPDESLEGNEVTNLISSNIFTKSRGFVPYCLGRSTVEVNFELLCPVNIHYIVIRSSVGSHKCNAIEVMAKIGNREYNSIGYAAYDNLGVIFCNSRFYSKTNPPSQMSTEYALYFFKSNTFRTFSTANFLKIKILRAKQIPCLAKVEVWGRPSKLCSSTTVSSLHRLMQGTIENPSFPVSNDTSEPDNIKLDNFKIADDFLDSLTFDVMAMPITLPSGNTVDQSTLDKYNESEAVYGRGPSDPFTRSKFTNTRKPVFNAALKRRIDMFLLLNSHRTETYTIKRTVGRTQPSSNSSQNLETFSGSSSSGVNSESDETLNNLKRKSSEEILEESIKRIKNSSTFVSFTEEKKVAQEPNVNLCSSCNDTDYLYVLPCEHLYCRTCLLKLCVELKCTKCDGSFNRQDAKRFYC